jgi:uncharacterized membrane protein YfcA
MLGFHVPQESFVATATAIALFVDGARLPVYLLTEWRGIVQVWPLILAATAGVIVGTAIGTPILERLPRQVFSRILSVLLIALGIYMAATGGR